MTFNENFFDKNWVLLQVCSKPGQNSNFEARELQEKGEEKDKNDIGKLFRNSS